MYAYRKGKSWLVDKKSCLIRAKKEFLNNNMVQIVRTQLRGDQNKFATQWHHFFIAVSFIEALASKNVLIMLCGKFAI